MKPNSILSLTLVLLALVNLSSQRTFPRLPLEVIQVMGSRAMRYHHFLWHNLRELWQHIDPPTQEAITALGWAPPRPSLIWAADGSARPNEENNSGEDFLYMHRQMVKKTNEILATVPGPYQKVVGFPSFPTPDDPDYPVPCDYVIPGVNQSRFTELVRGMKTDDFYHNNITVEEKALRDPERLRRMTLGQLGSKLEYTVHQWMHLRFSKKTPYGIRAPVNNPIPDIDKKWDDLSYQWLADSYGSHVNPIFWRIHGWVEDRIEDWRKANNHTEVPWEHTWEGGEASNIELLFPIGAASEGAKLDNDGRLLVEDGEGHASHHSMETMEKVFNLLVNAVDCESVLYKEVNVIPASQI